MVNILFNHETIGAWIGVLGTFFGTFLAGIISGVIALWTIRKQSKIHDEAKHKKEEKAIDIIVEFVDLSIASLLLIEPGVANTSELNLDIEKVELKKIKSVNFELSNISSELITSDMSIQFQNIRILLKILEIEIEQILRKKYSNCTQYQNELRKINIMGRMITIIESLKSFANISDELGGLCEELKNMQRNNK